MLQHPGARRLEESVKANFTCPGLSQRCKDITLSYVVCSEMKLANVVKDRQLPLNEDMVIKPWELLLVNLCGPWTIKCRFDIPKQVRTVKVWAPLTMLDEGSCWPKVMPIQNKYAEEIAQIVNDQWFD